MNRRRLSTFLTAVPVAVLALLAGPAVALADDSEAGATAVNVADQIILSETSASTQDDGSASATSIQLFGETVSGGTQEGTGETSGELVGTGDNEQGELSVGSWQASVTDDGSTADSAVVHGRLGDTSSDQYAEVRLLESHSRATSDGSESSTTGATVDLGGQLFLQLLHAQTSSGGDGSSALAIVNDEGIGTSEQFEGQCEIPADPLIHLLCLYADAHSGDTEIPEGAGGAGVADVVALDGNLTGDLFQASAAPAEDDAQAAPGEDVSDGSTDDDGTNAAPSGALPRTGMDLSLLAIGLSLLGTGTGLERVRRRA